MAKTNNELKEELEVATKKNEELQIGLEKASEENKSNGEALKMALDQIQELTKKVEAINEKNKNMYTDNVSTAPTDEDIKKENEHLMERIPFRAFKDSLTYKDDIQISFNGKNYVIQRGVEVMLPRCVVMALQNSDNQKLAAAEVQEELASLHNPDRKALE